MPEQFPAQWRTAIVLMPHPDDPEYGGMSAAVAKWTMQGRHVRYILACRGEVGIAGMAPEQAGPLREAEQRRAAAIVGVRDVDFWEEPDSDIRNTPALRATIAQTLIEHQPDMVLTVYGGPHWAPGQANQRDHIEFAAAVTQTFDDMKHPPRWLFAPGPGATHLEAVDNYIEPAVKSLAAHKVYLHTLDPQIPVDVQARRQIDLTTPARTDFAGRRAAHFQLIRGPHQ